MSEESQKDRNLIQSFMKQNLDKKEQVRFEQKMQEEDFANKVAEESVRWSSRSKLQSELKSMHQELIVSPSRWRMRIAMAAVFCLLTLSGIFYYQYTQSTQEDSPQKVFATYFDPYPNVFEQRNTQETLNIQKLQLALDAYDQQDYKKAIPLFESLIEEKTYDGSHLRFYYAISLLADQQATKAIPYFQGILSDTSSMLKSESKWYLALSYLQLGREEKVRTLLQEIMSDSTGYYPKKAQQLLK